MTVTEMLLEMRAAHAARTTYNRAADRLFRRAFRSSDDNDAMRLAMLGRMVRRCAAGEYDGHRSAR